MLTPPRTTAANGVSSGARHRIDRQGDCGRVAAEHRQPGSRAWTGRPHGGTTFASSLYTQLANRAPLPPFAEAR